LENGETEGSEPEVLQQEAGIVGCGPEFTMFSANFLALQADIAGAAAANFCGLVCGKLDVAELFIDISVVPSSPKKKKKQIRQLRGGVHSG